MLSSGPGGQHVNKTSSAVFIKDLETNISVKYGKSRDNSVNQAKAKQILLDKLDLHYNSENSKISKKIEKIKKQKDRQRRRNHSIDK